MDLLIQKKIQINDSDGISNASSLTEINQNEYTFNTEILEFLRAVRNKYRIYVLTNVGHTIKDEECSKTMQKNKQKIHEMLLKLCK